MNREMAKGLLQRMKIGLALREMLQRDPGQVAQSAASELTSQLQAIADRLDMDLEAITDDASFSTAAQEILARYKKSDNGGEADTAGSNGDKPPAQVVGLQTLELGGTVPKMGR